MAEPKSAGLWANSVSGGTSHYKSELFPRKCLSNFESRISLTSYSMSLSISTGGGGGWAHCGNGSSSAGSNWDMWKTGWTEWKCWGRRRVNECEPGMAITSYGPRFFLESFFDGLVVWKYFALT